MLTKIRNKATSIASYVLIALLCISFALFGISSYLGNPNDPAIATIAGEDISKSAFENIIRNTETSFRQQLGDQFDPSFTQNNQFRQNILDNIINQRIESNMVDKYRYTASDKELATYITSLPAYQVDGQFDQQAYEVTLIQNGLNVKLYEESQRKQLALNNFRKVNSLLNSYTPENLKQEVLKLANQERDVDYAIIDSNNVEVTVSEEDIQSYYDENKDDYRTFAQIKLSYVELSQDSFLDVVEVTDEQVSDYFERNKSRYTKPEERTARHILIKADDDQNSQSVALDKIKAIKSRIENGEDFAAVAKEVSEDAGSAQNGGDLGVINKGVMVKPFEDEVFTLEENEISEPIQTQYGLHLIQVTQILAESSQDIAEVRDDITVSIKEEQALIAFQEQSENFRNLAFENADTLEPIADELGLDIVVTDWLDSGLDNGILANPQIKATAFDEDFLSSDFNSDVIDTGDNLFVIRKEDYEESQIKPLSEVKSDIESIVKNEKILQSLEEKADEVVASLKSAQMSWDEFLTSNELESKKAPKSKKESINAEQNLVINSAFLKPFHNNVVYDSVLLSESIAIYQVNDVTYPDDLSTIEESQKQRIDQVIDDYNNNQSHRQVLDTLREDTKINIELDDVNIY